MDDRNSAGARPDSEQRASGGSGTNLIAAVIFVLGSFLLIVLLALGMGLVRTLTANPRLPAPTAAPAPVARIPDQQVYGGRPFTLFGAG